MHYLVLIWRLTDWLFESADILQALNVTKQAAHFVSLFNLACGEQNICALLKKTKPSL